LIRTTRAEENLSRSGRKSPRTIHSLPTGCFTLDEKSRLLADNPRLGAERLVLEGEP
jgi:hypothetical protein